VSPGPRDAGERSVFFPATDDGGGDDGGGVGDDGGDARHHIGVLGGAGVDVLGDGFEAVSESVTGRASSLM
jgi:hypothetical protein